MVLYMKRLLLLFLLSASLMFASEQSDLEKQVKIWAPRFGMEDWTITVEAIPEYALQSFLGYFCFGASTWDVDTKTGHILVLERSSYTKEMKEIGHIKHIKLDQKNTVVHEMIHNVVAHAEDEFAVQVLTEQIVPEHRISGINKVMKKLNIIHRPAAPIKGQ